MKDLATQVSANYLLQTQDEPPAFIAVKSQGWRTGPKEVLESLNDPLQADTIPATSYRFRLYVELETGDERYAFLTGGMWIGSGARRGNEGSLFASPAVFVLKMNGKGLTMGWWVSDLRCVSSGLISRTGDGASSSTVYDSTRGGEFSKPPSPGFMMSGETQRRPERLQLRL